MSYKQTIKYLESFINYERVASWPYKESLKLERFRRFLEVIGNPQDGLRYVHVAGTKGKGSTCAFIAYILREAGYKVGLYTSPHLVTFRERIRVLKPRPAGRRPEQDFEGMILKKELSQLASSLKPAIERYNTDSQYGPLSFFEIYTALAFVYFKQKKTDFVVLETGLGGRLDATNVVWPLVCAITPISYEHTDKLGNTLKKIAAEKAGIIKRHKGIRTQLHSRLVVISAPQPRGAVQVIRQRCRRCGASLYEVGKDIKWRKVGFRQCSGRAYTQAQRLEIKSLNTRYTGIKNRLVGEHQAVNAAVAVGVVDSLKNKGFNAGIDAINKGIYSTVWPGRCEVLSQRPLVILDGAQNAASALTLKNTIRKEFCYRRLILILGISSDKDVRGVCNQLENLADEVILTRADNPRAASPVLLEQYFQRDKPHLTKNIAEAVKLARFLTGKEDLVLITGSLFVVGEARSLLKLQLRRDFDAGV